ncbi:MAG: hypothetical protein ACLQPH_06080 [Acidimicrobiales bacterium]
MKAPALVLSVVLTLVTYRFVENPLRHWMLPSKRNVQLGLGASAATFLLLTVVIAATS